MKNKILSIVIMTLLFLTAFSSFVFAADCGEAPLGETTSFNISSDFGYSNYQLQPNPFTCPGLPCYIPGVGTLNRSNNNIFTFTPDPSLNPGDTVYVSLSLKGLGSASDQTVTVCITITNGNVNNPPVANNDSNSTVDNTTCKDINVTANDSDSDGDPLTIIHVTTPTFGSATITNATGGIIQFCPQGSCGTATFDYNISDGNGGSDVATVTVTVPCPNNPPVANNDYYSTDAGTEIVIPAPGVLANDTDPEGDPLEVYMHETDLTNPANGTLVINADGSFTYTPNDGFCGEDTFTYRAGDLDAVSERATVTIEVKCRKNNPLPESILYPGIDIESLSVPATGINVISDGKVVSQLEIAPGTQSILVEVENRGFLTQIDVGVRFEGLPQGITYTLPDLQKVKAHNIATYTVTLTVSPEVPQGTYQIRAVAYSRKGSRDRIDLTIVVE
mgnify:CR=1 FL=1